MTGADHTSKPEPDEAVPGPDSPPGRDDPPTRVDGETPSTGTLEGSSSADEREELLAVQEAALGSSSQESLLRLLGWRPGDPLPDVDGLGDALGEVSHGTSLSATVSGGSERPGGIEGGFQEASATDLLLPAEAEPVVPVNWNTLDADRAEQEWWQLDAFVYWLRDDFGLTPQELPPLWHRHPELVWELSALRTSWLAGHAEDAHAGSPLMWLRDLGDSGAGCGTGSSGVAPP